MLKRITLNLIALAALFLLCARAQAAAQNVGALRAKVHGMHLTKAAALAPCLTDMQCEQRDLSLYPPAARASILRGLADGSVHFEPSESGGEYIWTPAR